MLKHESADNIKFWSKVLILSGLVATIFAISHTLSGDWSWAVAWSISGILNLSSFVMLCIEIGRRNKKS